MAGDNDQKGKTSSNPKIPEPISPDSYHRQESLTKKKLRKRDRVPANRRAMITIRCLGGWTRPQGKQKYRKKSQQHPVSKTAPGQNYNVPGTTPEAPSPPSPPAPTASR